MSTSIHAHESLTVGDLVFAIAPMTDRKTLEITVDRDASLVLRAPAEASRRAPHLVPTEPPTEAVSAHGPAARPAADRVRA